jgi:Ca2+-binding RTX toxin-like protein
MNRLGKIGVAGGLVALVVAATALARGNPVLCTGGVCEGTPGSDQMTGSANEDDMRGLGGDDSLRGQGSDDILRGGAGSDDLADGIGDGRDTMLGGKGPDTLQGGAEGDTLRGGPGDERGIFVPRGGVPEYRIVDLFGDQGNDRIFGGPGRDSMEGEEGRDVLVGGSGSDFLDAVNDDTPGTRDRIECGRGFDRFVKGPGDKVDHQSCERRIPAPPLRG